MAGQTGSISVGRKEAPRGVDLSPTKDGGLLVLPNPSTESILWTLTHSPYESVRWSAVLDLPSEKRESGSAAVTTAYTGYDNLGRLRVEEIRSCRRSRRERISPEEEMRIALGNHTSDRIVFPDNLGGNRGYAEFIEKWLPTLTEEGFYVQSAKLVNFFDDRNRSIDDDNVRIISGITMGPNNITMHVLSDFDASKFVGITTGDKARAWFARLEQIETAIRLAPQPKQA